MKTLIYKQQGEFFINSFDNDSSAFVVPEVCVVSVATAVFAVCVDGSFLIAVADLME